MDLYVQVSLKAAGTAGCGSERSLVVGGSQLRLGNKEGGEAQAASRGRLESPQEKLHAGRVPPYSCLLYI